MNTENKAFYKKLFALVLPIALQNLMSAFVGASDALMLGMVDQESLSAVSLATQVQFVLSLFYAALTIGTTILAAQYWGKHNREAVEHILAFATTLSVLISTVFFMAALLCPAMLMRIFTNEETLIQAGAGYLHTVSWSYLLAAVSQIYLCIMKNSGRTLKSTLYSITSMTLNILLNAVLIFGLFGFPKLGIVGAAIATVIARLVELALVLCENARPDVVRLRLSNIVHTNRILKKDFWRYTAPVLANELVWGCGFTMFTVIMGHLGSDAIAANSYANIVKNLISCFCMGIGTGSGIMIGNELGRGNLGKARQDGGRLCRLAAVSGIFSGVVILLLTPLILHGVGNLTPTAHGYLRVMLFVCAYYIVAKSINSTTIAGIFCAGGDTKFGFLCDLITMWVIIIPLGLTAAFILDFPVLAVYVILNLDELVKLPAVYRNYTKYRWVKDLTRETNI